MKKLGKNIKFIVFHHDISIASLAKQSLPVKYVGDPSGVLIAPSNGVRV